MFASLKVRNLKVTTYTICWIDKWPWKGQIYRRILLPAGKYQITGQLSCLHPVDAADVQSVFWERRLEVLFSRSKYLYIVRGGTLTLIAACLAAAASGIET